jgi:hypothetical protein
VTVTYTDIDAIAAHVATRAAGDAWSDPDRSLLCDGLAPAPALLLDAFGCCASWLNDFAATVSAPVDYAAAGLLSAASAAIGAARRVSPWPGWAEYPALWCLNVGPPSASKSPVYGPLVTVLQEVEQEEGAGHEDRRRKWETDKLVSKLRREQWEHDTKNAEIDRRPVPIKPADADEPEEPKPPRLVVSDATVESLTPLFKANPRGLLLARDELAGWIGNFGKYGGDGDAAYFLERFTGAAATVDRVKAGTIQADRALLSVFGGIQPERMSELLLNRPDDGLVSRFLLFFPEPVARRRPAKAVCMETLGMALRRLRALRLDQDGDGRDAPRTLHLTPEAADVFAEWWKENGEAAADASGFEQGSLGKGPGLVLRLALIFELLEWAFGPPAPEPSAVGEQAVLWAVALFDDYFSPMAARVFGRAALSKEERAATALLRHIRKAGEWQVNASELRRARAAGLRTAAAMADALVKLAEAGWVRHAGGREGESKGRQRADWDVNPALWEAAP